MWLCQITKGWTNHEEMSHANSVFGIEWRDSWVQKTSICQWHTIVSVRFLNIIPFMRQNDQQNHEIALSTTSSMWKKHHFWTIFPWKAMSFPPRSSAGSWRGGCVLHAEWPGLRPFKLRWVGPWNPEIIHFSWDFPWQTFRKPLLFPEVFALTDRPVGWWSQGILHYSIVGNECKMIDDDTTLGILGIGIIQARGNPFFSTPGISNGMIAGFWMILTTAFWHRISELNRRFIAGG